MRFDIGKIHLPWRARYLMVQNTGPSSSGPLENHQASPPPPPFPPFGPPAGRPASCVLCYLLFCVCANTKSCTWQAQKKKSSTHLKKRSAGQLPTWFFVTRHAKLRLILRFFFRDRPSVPFRPIPSHFVPFHPIPFHSIPFMCAAQKHENLLTKNVLLITFCILRSMPLEL